MVAQRFVFGLGGSGHSGGSHPSSFDWRRAQSYQGRRSQISGRNRTFLGKRLPGDYPICCWLVVAAQS
jgi:hypothetical protein